MMETISTLSSKANHRSVRAVSEEIRIELLRKSLHLLIAFVPAIAHFNLGLAVGLLSAGVIFYAECERLRMKGYALLFASRLLKRPLATYGLLRTFSRHMKASDILKLLASPFRRRTLTCKAELPAKMLDAGLEVPLRAARVS